MFNPRKIGLAALAALLAVPVGAAAVYAASTQNAAAPAVAAKAQAGVSAHAADNDVETNDDNESKTGPEGAEKNEAPGQETPDKNEASESKAH